MLDSWFRSPNGRRHLRLVILAIMLVEGATWTVPSLTLSHPLQPLSRPRRTSALWVTNDDESNNINNNDDAVLSELDARVLQSMLQDEKLNLQEEENMKRLLERGIKNKEPVAQEAKRATEEKQVESEYSSQILKTLGDTKLWKGLSRNAADWFESAKIWVENKVERDTKLVASLGFFAFERALQDVKRALPASVVKQVAPKFMLDTTTSADQTTSDIRNQMTTPKDEIQAVTQEIRLIIQSGGDRKAAGLLPSKARGLQSAVSSKQGKDRFLKAYQRRKQTTLLREQESLAQTSARLAGTVIDSAYQVKRELQIEPNQPGYKTKALREGAVQTSKLLASGAKGFLSGAKAVAQAALTDGSNRANAPLPSSISPSDVEGMAATNAALDAALGKLNQKKPITSFIDATIVDATIADVQRPSVQGWPRRPRTVGDAPINARIPGTSSNNPSGMMTDNMSRNRTPFQPAPATPTDDTFAIPELKQDEEAELFFFASREAPDFQKEQSLSSLLSDIKKVESGQSESRAPYFSQVPPASTFNFESTAYVETEEQAGGSAYKDEIYEVDIDDLRNAQFYNDDVDDDEDDFLLDDEDPQDTLRRVMAEIVSDEDFEVAVGQAKRVDNTADQEVDNENTEPSILVVVLLRVLDVLFLVLEKFILALPSLLTSIPRVATRFAAVQNRGAGSSGWETISNAQRGERRY